MHSRHKGSHLHNNDASLVSRSAHVLCWQCALALSLSVRGPRAGQPGGVACRVCPPGCMLGDDARGSVSFDPQRSWAPFCDVICIWSIGTLHTCGLSWVTGYYSMFLKKDMKFTSIEWCQFPMVIVDRHSTHSDRLSTGDQNLYTARKNCPFLKIFVGEFEL